MSPRCLPCSKLGGKSILGIGSLFKRLVLALADVLGKSMWLVAGLIVGNMTAAIVLAAMLSR